MRSDTQANNAVTVFVDGDAVTADASMTVAAAIVEAGVLRTRRSLNGAARFAYCGMGACQECRVTIDGVAHRLACQVRCRDGMHVATTPPAGP